MSEHLKAVVYLDWDTTRRLETKRRKNVAGINYVFEKLKPEISNVLKGVNSRANFRVYWRIYHGWHQGAGKTPDRKIFDQFVVSATSQTIGKTSFSTEFRFSGDMACVSKRSPIVDTLRVNRQTGKPTQKMVDTLLACDLLHLAKVKHYDVHVIVANDDDAIPAIFTAEAWNAKVVLLHSRADVNRHLKLDGIAQRMST